MRSNFTFASLVFIIQLSAVLLPAHTVYSQGRPDGSQFLASTLAKRDAGTQILPHNVTQSWYSQAVAKLEEREYFIRTLDNPGMLGAVNHAQHLSYLFTEKGYTVSNFNEDGSMKGLWNNHFSFAGIGRRGRQNVQPLLHTDQVGNQSVQYTYRDYIVRYDNWKQGMEQSFILNKRPSGKKELQIAINVTGELEAAMGDNNQLLLYTAGHPKDVKLVYDQLTVLDQNKKRLPARIQVTDAHKLLLTVDDKDAVYPITVDPLNHTPNQTFKGDNVLGSGLVDATVHLLYGFSISGAGDVDGDGIDDIIIGSPTFTQINVLSGGVLTTLATVTGAAFVYYGVAASGPLTTPSKVLQPTGLPAGALFGYSVSTAGKFDGSTGRSGVVVGAPGDKITLTVALLPTLVATGKVYLYSGNAFAGDVNTVPTPSSTLSLQPTDFGTLLFLPPLNPFFGFSVSNAGNMDGDTFDDIVVGSPYYTAPPAGALLAGRVDIFKGGATGIITTPARTIQGQTASQLFGFSVSSTGKTNSSAPTFDGIIAGAPGFLASIGQLQGHAYLFYGKAGGVTATAIGGADQTLSAGSGIIASLFGFSVSTAGDVNGDGADDVIVGEPLALDLTGAAGKAYIYYGSSTGIVATGGTTLVSPRSPTILGGLAQNLLFGYSVGKAGNVTGDAAGEVLVGEPGSAALSNPVIGTLLGLLTGQANIGGQAYIFKGTVGSHIANNTAPFLTLNDPGVLTAANLLGASVHYAGDVNDDGFDDFLIGSPNGTLDLGINLSLLSSLSAGAPGVFGSGLITTANTGNVYLFNGFQGPLPVTWLSFTGSAEKADAQLNWATAQEQNSNYYGVERSSDNSTFVAIGTVTAAHNSNSVTNYSFTDASPVNGMNYYRLKQVDLDGQFVYSKVVAVNFNGTEANVVAVYPNPAHESFQLQFRNMKAGQYEMNLISPVGQVIQSRSIQVNNPANYAETVNLASGLAQGTYIVRIVDQQQHVFISKVVIR